MSTEIAQRYFDTWNAHDVAGLRALFADDVTLRDWDVEVQGAATVAEANGNIFTAVPGIVIEVLTMHPSPSTNSVVCEILVKLNNDTADVLKVVDILEFDGSKIKHIRAFKG
ncbi:hypothetical protein M885DRAFT_530823 [Pelagophyceae sp. CCMP2097]|nr:hypothetical protein M885DRAFT_530823 [Pelagophyceae sp. CCMP2097]|mmetsp:Transcript_20373/g.69060  ORF Transcript_20373/g.69060 Transcript_20373/m.69060 type:complete len:112 (+) Transcript_20373:55-390(+)